MLLITELTEDVEYLTEAKKDGIKEHYIQGIFLQGNLKNRNGRMYPMETLETEVNRYIREKVDTGRSTGELGHPQGPQINLDRVSHLITELKRDGDNYFGKARLGPGTPMGQTAIGLIEMGVSLGVSSRGMGSLKSTKDGIMEVQNDFHLATAGDIVADPSAPDAFVKGIMEGVSWIYSASSNSWHQERLENTQKALKQRKQIDEAVAVRVFKNFLDSLSKSS
ncbi:MAG: primosomal protein [Candidatus Bathyarchaeia archaeon]